MSTTETQEQPTKAMLSFSGRNPDVLTCIANLSNDEVFTPPELANQMLDLVAEGWADANDGANIWADSSVTFLDPATKTGVFLREITKRLIEGLADEIPDLQKRVDHILTKQVFGIGITELTAMLARRSLYCSKHARRTDQNPHSVASSFDTDEGNIWFERTEHTWTGGKKKELRDDKTGKTTHIWVGRRCKFCGAGESTMGRGDDLESHAYAFIHTDDIKTRITELFGADMQFDVIIGNPPYQMTGGAGGSSDSSIYQLFVEQAQRLQPRFLNMVIPARWMAGGRGLDEFRNEMLASGHIREMVDFQDSNDAFPGVQIKGGSCYFRWDRDHQGYCDVTYNASGITSRQRQRNLAEFDVFIRDERSLSILRKVLRFDDASVADMISGDTPFGLASNFAGHHGTPKDTDIELHLISGGKRKVAYMPRTSIGKNQDAIDVWKVFVPKAYGAGDSFPHQILGREIVAAPGSVCTQSYLIVQPFHTRDSADSFASYYQCRLFRFLVWTRKITQDAMRRVYTWVPQQTWDRTWTDEELYAKYKLTKKEIAFIESMIRPMLLRVSHYGSTRTRSTTRPTKVC